MVKYKLVWVSELTEAQGEGKPFTDNYDYAKSVANKLNAETPWLKYDVVKVDTEEPE